MGIKGKREREIQRKRPQGITKKPSRHDSSLSRHSSGKVKNRRFSSEVVHQLILLGPDCLEEQDETNVQKQNPDLFYPGEMKLRESLGANSSGIWNPLKKRALPSCTQLLTKPLYPVDCDFGPMSKSGSSRSNVWSFEQNLSNFKQKLSDNKDKREPVIDREELFSHLDEMVVQKREDDSSDEEEGGSHLFFFNRTRKKKMKQKRKAKINKAIIEDIVSEFASYDSSDEEDSDEGSMDSVELKKDDRPNMQESWAELVVDAAAVAPKREKKEGASTRRESFLPSFLTFSTVQAETDEDEEAQDTERPQHRDSIFSSFARAVSSTPQRTDEEESSGLLSSDRQVPKPQDSNEADNATPPSRRRPSGGIFSSFQADGAARRPSAGIFPSFRVAATPPDSVDESTAPRRRRPSRGAPSLQTIASDRTMDSTLESSQRRPSFGKSSSIRSFEPPRRQYSDEEDKGGDTRDLRELFNTSFPMYDSTRSFGEITGLETQDDPLPLFRNNSVDHVDKAPSTGGSWFGAPSITGSNRVDPKSESLLAKIEGSLIYQQDSLSSDDGSREAAVEVEDEFSSFDENFRVAPPSRRANRNVLASSGLMPCGPTRPPEEFLQSVPTITFTSMLGSTSEEETGGEGKKEEVTAQDSQLNSNRPGPDPHRPVFPVGSKLKAPVPRSASPEVAANSRGKQKVVGGVEFHKDKGEEATDEETLSDDVKPDSFPSSPADGSQGDEISKDDQPEPQDMANESIFAEAAIAPVIPPAVRGEEVKEEKRDDPPNESKSIPKLSSARDTCSSLKNPDLSWSNDAKTAVEQAPATS